MSVLEIESRQVGGISYAAHEIGGFTYRASPIEHRQQIVIPGLPAKKAVEVDLLHRLSFPMLVTGIVLDVAEDDNNPLGESDRDDNLNYWVDLRVQSLNRVTKFPESKITFKVQSFPDLKNELILDPLSIYRFKSSRNLNSIIITGRPVFLKDRLVYTDKIVID